jgi:histidinol-phosphate aminotransferase
MDYQKLIRPEILAIEPYVPGKPIEEVQRELGLTDVIKLASNENPLGPSLAAKKLMEERANGVALYPDASAYALKEALAHHFGLTTRHFFVGNGSDEVIKVFSETFYNPGDEVIIPAPTFSVYASAARLMGAELVIVKGEDGYRHDLNRMLQEVTPRTKAIFICCPNNPTGTVVSKAELSRFLQALPKQILVVIDQAYLDYNEDPECASGMDYLESGRVLVLRTYSKIHGLAGLRLGYGIGHPDLIDCLNRVKEPFSVNILAQQVGIAALNAMDHVEKSLQINRAGKAQIGEGLERLGLKYLPTQANFILFEVPTDTKPIYEQLLKRGVIIRRADSFGLPKHFRVTIGLPEQNKRFLQALEEVMQENV